MEHHQRFAILVFAIPTVLFSATTLAAPRRTPAIGDRPAITSQSGSNVLSSSRTAGSFKRTCEADTFCIYGGPGSLLGKFQTATLQKDRQSWTSHDATDLLPLWQAHTFNSPTGSMAMWAGRTAAQEPAWRDAPGYGNHWNALLEYRATVSDPASGQTIGLDFLFNHDTEPTYDFFDVEYDSAGMTVGVLHLDGSNRDGGGAFVPLSYANLNPRAIVYGAHDYGGPANDEIVIRLALRSDGAWSDEDGKYESDGGAQVDDITVTNLDGSDFEDFEGNPLGFHWQPQKAPFAGDFGEVFTMIDDLDPCMENATPGLGFIDDGLGPYNPTHTGGGTGGTMSNQWNYGVVGHWVVNYSGGITAGLLALDNEWWSPEILWDLPGTTADDAPEIAGARLRFSVWNHLPLINGIFYQWAVRGYEPAIGWSRWANRNFLRYSQDPLWQNMELEVSDLLPANKDKIQIQLSVRDRAAFFAFAGTDATPSPIFDNVSFLKYDIGGPLVTARSMHLSQDSFSQGGGTEVSTEAARDLLDVRVDMARDVNTGALNTAGDSIVVDVLSVIPGVAITDSLNLIELHYSLNMNPLFEAAIRENAPSTGVATGIHGWDQHEGVLKASQSYTSSGTALPDRYFFDPPDVDFMYPGDVLEFYIRAEDDAANVTTLPMDLTGFDDPAVAYDRTYTMHALPSFTDTDGSHVELLVWNDSGRGVGEEALLSVLDELNHMVEGIHFDMYTTVEPSSRLSNGLGSAGVHGANVDQLDGYGWIIYEAGDHSATLSNGDDGGSDDKGADSLVLRAWYERPRRNRGIAHFGDNIATDLADMNSDATYLATVLGASWIAQDIRSAIGGQTAPLVRPEPYGAWFHTDFIVYGGCPLINRFDQVAPNGPAVVTHHFVDRYMAPVGNASIYSSVTTTDTDAVDWTRQSLLFPYGLVFIQTPAGKISSAASSSAKLVEEILWLMDGGHLYPPDRISVPPDLPIRSLKLRPPYPNPFNPQTILSFDLGRAATGSVKIYNLRGALVRTLAEGDFSAGRNTLRWRGQDNAGANVASGVYLVRYAVDGFEESQKIVMVE